MSSKTQERYAEVDLQQAAVLVQMMLKEGPRRVTINLEGGAGIGKTTVVRFLENLDPRIKVIFVPTAAVITEPGDLAGMPKVLDGRTVYMAPYWAVEANEAARSGAYDIVVLLLDDYNRVPAQILQSLMPVFLDYKVGSLDLDPEVRVVLTSNPATSDKYATRGLDFAQVERMETLHVRFDFKVFMDYTLRNNWVPEWVAFLNLYKEVVGTDGEGISPRTCEFANQALRCIKESGASIMAESSQLRLDARIGAAIRSSFITCCKTQESIIFPENILKGDFSKTKFEQIKKKPDIINLTYSRLSSHLHDIKNIKADEVSNVQAFMLGHESDELTYVFLKSLSQEMGLKILSGPVMREIRKRVYDD
jgi:hypothetical protein